MSANRLDRVREVLAAQTLDAILITSGTNRRYLTGFTAEDHAADELSAVGLISIGNAWLLAPSTNLPWAQAEAVEGVTAQESGRDWTATVAQIARDQGWKRIGFEDAMTTVANYNALKDALGDGVALQPLGDATDQLRAVKDDEEIALLRRAVELTDIAFVAAEKRARAGMTEKALAEIVAEELRNAGSEGEAFPTIVASGPNAAKPHHAPGERMIQEGEPVIIDMGALHQGYAGDLTRTIWFGQPSEQLVTMYAAVQAAHDAALAKAVPGMTGVEFDAVARDVFAERQLDQYFVHSLGHGLGLRVHEAPSASMRSTHTLAPGHVVTVEPGVYIPDWGGVRIEDVILITADGNENLTTAPKCPVDTAETEA